jgi:uncharacterized protein (TIGR02466 family)
MPAELIRAQKLFATPVIVGDMVADRLNEALERAILANRAADPGIKRSNVGGGWHSDLKLADWGGEPARRLINEVIGVVNQQTMVAGGTGKETLRWRIEGWANVNQRGAANARHVHGGCYWSAVYYVKVPEDGKGGNLILYDPRMPTLAMHAPRLRFRDAGGEREVRIKPKEGRLVVFPSWLAHEVEAWEGDELRISIAINLLAMAPGGTAEALKADEAAAKAPAISSPTETPR